MSWEINRNLEAEDMQRHVASVTLHVMTMFSSKLNLDS